MKRDKVLIILNYQREIPPFMQMQIRIAYKFYGHIYYVTPKLIQDNRETVTLPNVSIVEVSKINRIFRFAFSGLLCLFKSYFWDNVINAPFSFSKIKYLFTQVFCSDCLYVTSLPLVEKAFASGVHVDVLATWFSVEALAVARIKKKHPNIHAVSYAHSFEIDPDKNSFVGSSFNAFKHEFIDKIHFISYKMRDIYFNEINSLGIPEVNLNRNQITYLGSIKEYPKMNFSSSDKVFRICSCSGVTAVKRLHLIAQALELWNECEIEWTHLGGGPLYDEIAGLAERVCAKNHLVKIRLLGQKSNIEVQKYYTENPVDLFVNVSEAEGLPVSIMEAASYGIPILATDVGGTSEIVNDNTGRLINKSITPSELSASIYDICKLQNDIVNNMRINASILWQEKFNALVCAESFYSNL